MNYGGCPQSLNASGLKRRLATLSCASSSTCAFVEHPAYPMWARHQRPSGIWTAAAMKWLAGSSAPPMSRSISACLGAPGERKPTTLLLIRLPWLRNQILRLGEGGRCPHGQGQHAALQGRDESGSFRTAVAKIYPAAMNAAISHAIAHFVVKTFGLELAPEGLAEDPMDFSQMDFVSKCVVQPDCCLVLADS